MSNGDAHRVLVVEDDDSLRELLIDEFAGAGYQTAGAANAEQALAHIRDAALSAVISDIRLPGSDGLALLRNAQRFASPPAFIMITAYGTISQAVEALKAGADDFLTKPVDLEYLLFRVGRVLHTRRLESELRRYKEILRDNGMHGMVGRSPPMLTLFDSIRRVAAAQGPVLIEGESGSGKELVARAVHNESARVNGPFVAVNCAGIPADLLESELFGHASGAFTGAVRSRTGLFREAHGGTLFLDELGEMPAAMQAKLLRVLEDGNVRPVGESREIPVDVRLVAATNRDLEHQVERERFRKDLFYRLETFRLRVPPLRDRESDIELLAMYLLRRFAAAMDRDISGFDEAALACLRAWPFPGNVRELANAVERAVAFCERPRVGETDLPERMRGSAPLSGIPARRNLLLAPDEPLPTLAAVEQRFVRHVLERVDGNKQKAARVLGIGRRTLYRRLEEGPEGE